MPCGGVEQPNSGAPGTPGRATGANALFCFTEAASILAGEKENIPGTPPPAAALEVGRVGEVQGPPEVERKETFSQLRGFFHRKIMSGT